MQRFTPRKPGSAVSEMNKERIRRLIRRKKMTSAGLAAIQLARGYSTRRPALTIATDILAALKREKKIWTNFRRYPDSYKRIRIGWIEGAWTRRAVFD